MKKIFNIKINFDSNQGGGDIASQHAQIASALQHKEQKKDDFQGLLSNLPMGKTIESAASALDVLNKSIAPQIDSIVNLGKDAQLNTGSIASSLNLGGVIGSLKILGEQVTVKTDAYDPSILTAQAPAIDGSGGGKQDDHHEFHSTGDSHHGGESQSSESHESSSSSHNADYDHGSYQESNQNHYENMLPDLSGISGASNSSQNSHDQSFVSRISQSRSQGGHGQEVD
jgi:hypothetical protein